MDSYSSTQCAVAEGFGTAFLLAAVVGSGMMGERLAPGNEALILLVNALSTGATLVALIAALQPISGAHLNPAVTLAEAALGDLPWRKVPGYLFAQLLGAFLGVAATHVMFEAPLFSWSTHTRGGTALVFSEFIATFGLLLVILGCARTRKDTIPWVVGTYITGAYWFTASTSFANPAVTLARSVSNTFTGIWVWNIPGFLLAQLLGAACAAVLFFWLRPLRHAPQDKERISD